ncbi:MAG: hypothetical protein VCE43_19660 [Myxococcota bacterium]
MRSWHVSPAIDIAAYHFSWLWILIPLLLAGPEFPTAYFPLYVAVLTFGFVHRHYTLGYAYLDAEVFARHRMRFIWVPLILGAGLLATPYLLRASIPSGALTLGEFGWPKSEFRLKIILTSIIFAAGVWNIWHTMAQKYGILRIYTAKARTETQNAGVPGWVDRLFIMGWLPLIVCYVAPRFSETVIREFKIAQSFVEPVLVVLTAGEDILVPVSVAIAAASAVTFAVFEWRINRFRNRPRLSMSLGTTALWACFVVFDPIKVYLAFAFSHGLEYMVFVWAFQRRRYAEHHDPQPLMGRILEHPWIAYPLYTFALGGLYVLLHEWKPFDFWRIPSIRVATLKFGQWVFFWGVFQSLLHFYYDGFLWKTRYSAMTRSL